MKYSEEQIASANNVDLVRFLTDRGERFKKSGREVRWTTHDSVTIKDNQWFRHSQGKGGGPIDFLMEFYEKTFPEAMEMLLEETGILLESNNAKGVKAVLLPAPSPHLV